MLQLELTTNYSIYSTMVMWYLKYISMLNCLQEGVNDLPVLSSRLFSNSFMRISILKTTTTCIFKREYISNFVKMSMHLPFFPYHFICSMSISSGDIIVDNLELFVIHNLCDRYVRPSVDGPCIPFKRYALNYYQSCKKVLQGYICVCVCIFCMIMCASFPQRVDNISENTAHILWIHSASSLNTLYMKSSCKLLSSMCCV